MQLILITSKEAVIDDPEGFGIPSMELLQLVGAANGIVFLSAYYQVWQKAKQFRHFSEALIAAMADLDPQRNDRSGRQWIVVISGPFD